MALPPPGLQGPLSWRMGNRAVQELLDDMQCNVLKPHGRNHAITSLLVFEGEPAIARTALSTLGAAATSAFTQLVEAERYCTTGVPGNPLVSVALASTGYEALAIDATRRPIGKAFDAGLAARRKLTGLDTASWEEAYRGRSHALLLVADDHLAVARAHHATILREASAAVRVVASEEGTVLRNEQREPIEHFGYVDGRSQPLVLYEDVQRERDEGGGDSRWNAEAPLSVALVACPGGTAGRSFGSFLVYLKLEQDVAGFDQQVADLAARLGCSVELAGAMVVGRHRDGTPLVMREKGAEFHPVWNNFDYANDVGGGRCPLHAHTRRMNPRGSSNQTDEQERSRRILRRGITYGQRVQDPTTRAFLDAPSKDVGLLFLGYQSSLEKQFEFLLTEWAVGRGFPGADRAADPLIGPEGKSLPRWPTGWDQTPSHDQALGRFVTPLGGEYFFVPCLSFLRGLGQVLT